MAFSPKLLFLFGWMLIFSLGIVESFNDPILEEYLRPKPDAPSTFQALFRPDHFSSNLSTRYTAHVYLYKLSDNGAESAEEYFCGDFPYSDDTELGIFPPTFNFTETESDEGLNFMVAVIVGKNSTNQSSVALTRVYEGILRSKKSVDSIFNRTINHSQPPNSTEYVQVNVYASYISWRERLIIRDEPVSMSSTTDTTNNATSLLPSRLTGYITKGELDEGLEFIVAVIGKSKTMTLLRDGTSGGPAAVNPSKGASTFTIGVLLAVALHLV